MGTPPTFDAVVPVGPQHVRIARLSLRALAANARPSRIHVIASAATHRALRRAVPGVVVLHDEDRLLPGLTLAGVADAIRARGVVPDRAGWYHQQFVKLGAPLVVGCEDRCLLWDADTVLLRPTAFFDGEGRALVAREREHHAPYFRTQQRLLGFGKVAPFSFVAQHLPLRTDHLRRLLDRIAPAGAAAGAWAWRILEAVDSEDLAGAGFSEYETCGSFVLERDPASVVCRTLPSERHGSLLFGAHPGRLDLRRLARAFALASFEVTPCAPRLRALRNRASSVLTPWRAPARA